MKQCEWINEKEQRHENQFWHRINWETEKNTSEKQENIKYLFFFSSLKKFIPEDQITISDLKPPGTVIPVTYSRYQFFLQM